MIPLADSKCEDLLVTMQCMHRISEDSTGASFLPTYVSTYVRTYISYVHIHTYVHTYLTYICIRMCIHILCMYVHTYPTYIYIRTYVHTYLTYICICMCIHILCMYVHTYPTYVYVYTYVCTYIYIIRMYMCIAVYISLSLGLGNFGNLSISLLVHWSTPWRVVSKGTLVQLHNICSISHTMAWVGCARFHGIAQVTFDLYCTYVHAHTNILCTYVRACIHTCAHSLQDTWHSKHTHMHLPKSDGWP